MPATTKQDSERDIYHNVVIDSLLSLQRSVVLIAGFFYKTQLATLGVRLRSSRAHLRTRRILCAH